jgi:hypothetical protein
MLEEQFLEIMMALIMMTLMIMEIRIGMMIKIIF